ncbi:MAG TPA: hypothetical protein VIM61_09275 [Chthoniobacterales bacterium]
MTAFYDLSEDDQALFRAAERKAFFANSGDFSGDYNYASNENTEIYHEGDYPTRDEIEQEGKSLGEVDASVCEESQG